VTAFVAAGVWWFLAVMVAVGMRPPDVGLLVVPIALVGLGFAVLGVRQMGAG
jgi:uncharacterized membrane-anchored protein